MYKDIKPKDPLDHEPEAVAWARAKAGLSQAELAVMIGVSPALITKIENGTRNARPAVIERLAAALNCPRVVLERKRHATWPGYPGYPGKTAAGRRAAGHGTVPGEKEAA